MAIKKPLVLNSGEIEQLQSGDSLSEVDLLQQINGNAGAIVIGTPVYSSANGTVDKARADVVATVNVIGLVADTSIASAGTGGIITNGVLTASTGQWDAVASTSGGLTRNVIYYLSAATAGLLVSTAPSVAGQFVVRVGIAISTTELLIGIERRIKL